MHLDVVRNELRRRVDYIPLRGWHVNLAIPPVTEPPRPRLAEFTIMVAAAQINRFRSQLTQYTTEFLRRIADRK